MTEKEIEKYIIDNYFIKNQFEIAEDLGMTRNQINRRARKIGIRKTRLLFEKENDEIVKPMKEYNNLYAITSKGRVVNLKTKTLCKQKIDRSGYYIVNIQIDKKRTYFRIHRMLGIYFVNGRTSQKNEIDHINCNKLDNRLENLEWVTHVENTKRAQKNGLCSHGSYKTNSKINEEIAIAIYNDYHKNKLTQRQCWEKYNTTRSVVQKIVLKQRWKYIHKRLIVCND